MIGAVIALIGASLNKDSCTFCFGNCGIGRICCSSMLASGNNGRDGGVSSMTGDGKERYCL